MPERIAPTLSQAHTFRSATCVRLRRGASAAHPRDSDGLPMATRRVTNRQSDDPGLCRRCAAALSSAADAPTYITLGSHAKSGLRMRHSPGRAVTCGHRNGASLSATDATNPAAWRRGSTHPDHRMRGLNRVLLRARIESWTDVATPTRRVRQRRATSHRAKPDSDLASATSGCRHLRVRTVIPVERARIARQTWGAHRWRIEMRTLRSTILNGML